MRRQPDVPEHHRRVARALGSGGPAMPDSLARQIDALERAATAEPRPRRRRIQLARPVQLTRPVLVGGVAVVTAIAVAVALSLSGTGGPTVVEAAQLGGRSAEQPPPARDPARPRMLARSFAGVGYPDWSRKFGWRAEGERDDELGDRRTTTVFYRHTHHRIGYTVLAGKAIQPPDGAERVTVNGLVLHRFRVDGQDAVAFVRNGRTCVLSGKVHDPDTLVKLASWRA